MNINLTIKEADIIIYSLCRHTTELQEQISEWEKNEIENRQKITQHTERIDVCDKMIEKILKASKKG